MEKWVIRPDKRGLIRQFMQRRTADRPPGVKGIRLLPFLVLASAGGILAAYSSARIWLLPLLAMLITLISLFCLRHQPFWFRIALPLLLACSAVQTSLILIPAENQARIMAGKNFVLQGIVCSGNLETARTVQVMIRQKNGVKISFTGPGNLLQPGNLIIAPVCAERPSGQRNPGGFDEAGWLARQGVFLQATLAEGREVQVAGRQRGINLDLWGSLLRQQFYVISCRFLSDGEAALLSGLLLGDTSHLQVQVKSEFSLAGLAHLTSVSGANVSFILLPAGRFLRKKCFNRKARLWILLGLLFGFGFLTGWQVSVTRAVLMSAVVLAGRLLHRPADAVSSLALALVLMLLGQPLAACSAGFWLSAAATASLLIFCEPITDKIQQSLAFLPAWLCRSLAGIICVQAAILPLVSQISQGISLPGILANLPAMPAAGCITLLAVIILPFALVCSMFPGEAGPIILKAIGRPLGFCLDLLGDLARMTAHCQAGRLFRREMNLAFWLIWLSLMACWVIRRSRQNRLAFIAYKAARWISYPSIAAWILIMLFNLPQEPVKVWFLDVGQGDAILVQAGDGRTVLVDGGGPGAGYKIIMPALDALGIERIDAAIATHGHADHTGGLIELIESRRISQLIIPAGLEGPTVKSFESDLAEELKITALKLGIKVSETSRDDTIVLGSQIRLQVLNPCASADPDPVDGDSGNGRSLILLARLGSCSMLLTADCTEDTEKRLLDQKALPAVEILKVAHHGSRMTTSAAFLAIVRPAAAVISVGPNLYGHPAPLLLQRLKDAGCNTFRTDRQGAVLWTIKPDKWEIAAMLPQPGPEPVQ